MTSSENSFELDTNEWIPPTDAELKVIEARRERNDKISSLMGQYLLKGYKMLAVSCSECDCILLEDKQQRKYCVACTEVDADTNKDNPAVNVQAARRTVEESMHRQNYSNGVDLNHSSQCSSHSVSQINIPTENIKSSQPANQVSADLIEELHNTSAVLTKKLSWSSQQLQDNSSVSDSIQLATLITQTVTALSNIVNLEKLINSCDKNL